MPTVKVSDHVKNQLEEIKNKEGHSSYDSAIRVMLMAYEVDA